MRIPAFLSPTSIAIWLKNKEEYYIIYLADCKPPKIQQLPVMAIGSAFDAFVKSYLYEALFGKNHNPKYELNTIFDAQVEPQNKDKAFEAGAYLFSEYKKAGCLADMMLELKNSAIEPRFELSVSGVVEGYREGVTKKMEGVTFLGKPDVFYMNSLGARVNIDWKVNGFYSERNVSPMQGYVRLRERSGDRYVNKGSHKECFPMLHKGLTINAGQFLEILNEDWARQLAIYSWLLGEEVGGECIVGIDQLACGPNRYIRFAEHRLRIGKDFQFKVFAQAQELWEIIHSDYIFRNLTYEESQTYQHKLNERSKALFGTGSEEDKWFNAAVRG